MLLTYLQLAYLLLLLLVRVSGSSIDAGSAYSKFTIAYGSIFDCRYRILSLTFLSERT
jgi:hypothetical protein